MFLSTWATMHSIHTVQANKVTLYTISFSYTSGSYSSLCVSRAVIMLQLLLSLPL